MSHDTLDDMSVADLTALAARVQATLAVAQQREAEQGFTRGLDVGEVKQIDGVWYGRGTDNFDRDIMYRVRAGVFEWAYKGTLVSSASQWIPLDAQLLGIWSIHAFDENIRVIAKLAVSASSGA